ncbi:MAG: NifU N-terminal domain-containing protein [Aggregatilineales bacterium]
MSEYVTVETERTNKPDVINIIVNQTLTTDDEEVYENAEEGDEGSTLAQALFIAVEGIRALTITEDTLTITRDPDVTWEDLVDEVRDVLRDFFL